MRLATRLFTAQLVVIATIFAALLVTILVVAPGLFRHHLAMTGEESPSVQQHAQQAFESSVGLALVAAAVVAVLAAVALSWFLARRVSRPIESLADAAESVARGQYDVSVPDGSFARELSTLSTSFHQMADDLATTDEARTRLLSDLAHEIRTPLATLEAHIDGLEDGVVADDAASYDVMRHQVRRLQRLAADVRLAAAAQEHALNLRVEQVRVSDVLQTACATAAARYAERGIHLGCEERADGTVLVDPDRIQQVLGNLLDNALRYANERVDLTCGEAAGWVVIAVSDDGPGIPSSELEAVFTRFHRVDPSRTGEGSGLGLTIARAIVAAHGGTLTAVSPAGTGGTTMVVRLPRGSDHDR